MLFDKRNEQLETDKRLQMDTARRCKTTVWTITENVTFKIVWSSPEHVRNVVPIPHFPRQRNSVYTANRTMGLKISKKYEKKLFSG